MALIEARGSSGSSLQAKPRVKATLRVKLEALHPRHQSFVRRGRAEIVDPEIEGRHHQKGTAPREDRHPSDGIEQGGHDPPVDHPACGIADQRSPVGDPPDREVRSGLRQLEPDCLLMRDRPHEFPELPWPRRRAHVHGPAVYARLVGLPPGGPVGGETPALPWSWYRMFSPEHGWVRLETISSLYFQSVILYACSGCPRLTDD